MAVINRKGRFATEGIRFQRHNPDGTIPHSGRALGFHGTANLFGVLKNGSAPMTIKIGAEPAVTRDVFFESNTVTVEQAVTALNKAGFAGLNFEVDGITGRLRCSGGTEIEKKGSYARIEVEVTRTGATGATTPAGLSAINLSGDLPGNRRFYLHIPATITWEEGQSRTFVYEASSPGPRPVPGAGEVPPNPGVVGSVGGTAMAATFPQPGFELVVVDSYPGSVYLSTDTVQITGPLAAAFDFGQSLRHGGNGLEMISFFDDETVSIGLPKNVKDKEEIDIEGAKGTIRRMIIGATHQGMSPVVTLKNNDLYLKELIQGGRLDRANGSYEPPGSNESEHPSFYAEIFSPIYSDGSHKLSDVAGYERLLLRSMLGLEGDVPVGAKAWAEYAFNCEATTYTDEYGDKFPAWQEQTLTLEQFDELRLNQIDVSRAV